jgi:predicted phage terminase large subunit-like protein
MYIDPFFFAEVLFSDKNNPMHYHMRCKSPKFHKEIFNELLHLEPGDKMAVVAPRGHAKTTLVSFIYPLHQMLFGEERFILLISESETQSKYLLEAIGNEIEYNKKVHEYFGNRMGETWGKEEKEVITGFDEYGKSTGMCKVLIRGTGQKVRGLKYGPYRPTLTIIDDGEGESNTMTELSREKFVRWFNAAVIPGSTDAKLCFIGTIVDDNSYLNRIAGRRSYSKAGDRIVKGWKTRFYQAIPQNVDEGRFVASGKEFRKNKQVQVLWKEHRSYKWLKAEKDRLASEGHVSYFYQEYQNIPMDDSFRIFKEKDIQYWEGYYTFDNGQSYVTKISEKGEERVPVNTFMGVDPASSENKKADYTVIMVIAVDPDFNIYVIDYFRGQVSPMDGADRIFAMSDIYNPRAIKIEETGHVMLADYIQRRSKETGRFMNINPKQAIKNKFYRIKQMQPYFASKAIFVRETHFDLIDELLQFKETGSFKKDTLDALRWALDDVWKPNMQFKNNAWVEPDTSKTRVDWETGQVFYS